jgi:hypothetical protein
MSGLCFSQVLLLSVALKGSAEALRTASGKFDRKETGKRYFLLNVIDRYTSFLRAFPKYFEI